MAIHFICRPKYGGCGFEQEVDNMEQAFNSGWSREIDARLSLCPTCATAPKIHPVCWVCAEVSTVPATAKQFTCEDLRCGYNQGVCETKVLK